MTNDRTALARRISEAVWRKLISLEDAEDHLRGQCAELVDVNECLLYRDILDSVMMTMEQEEK